MRRVHTSLQYNLGAKDRIKGFMQKVEDACIGGYWDVGLLWHVVDIWHVTRK